MSKPLFIALTSAAILFVLLPLVLVFRRSSSSTQAASIPKKASYAHESGTESESDRLTDDSESEDDGKGRVRGEAILSFAEQASR